MANLLSGLIGVIVGAVITTLVAFIQQRREWARRDQEIERERAERAEADKTAETQRQTAVVRALAIEAFTNAVSLLTFAETAAKGTAKLNISRRQFDAVMPSMLEWPKQSDFDTVLRAYMDAFIFEQSVARPGYAFPAKPEHINQARELSFSFEIVFRGLGQSADGFSRQTHCSLERRLQAVKQLLPGQISELM